MQTSAHRAGEVGWWVDPRPQRRSITSASVIAWFGVRRDPLPPRRLCLIGAHRELGANRQQPQRIRVSCISCPNNDLRRLLQRERVRLWDRDTQLSGSVRRVDVPAQCRTEDSASGLLARVASSTSRFVAPGWLTSSRRCTSRTVMIGLAKSRSLLRWQASVALQPQPVLLPEVGEDLHAVDGVGGLAGTCLLRVAGTCVDTS